MCIWWALQVSLDAHARVIAPGRSVCERLNSQPHDAFAFVAPSRSLDFIQDYLENSGGVAAMTSS